METSLEYVESMRIQHRFPCKTLSVCWWAYLEDFHGQLAHSRSTAERRNMKGGGVLQKVLGLPLLVLPAVLALVMGEHRLLSELDL